MNKRAFVFLWYVPILIVLAMGLIVSLDRGVTESIVQKSRSFQGLQEASQELETVDTMRYNLVVNLDETFSVKDADGNELDSGDLRAGDELEIPYTYTANMPTSSIRLELIGQDRVPFLKGFFVRTRSCETAWRKDANTYVCDGPSSVVAPGHDVSSDSFSVMDDGDQVGKGDKLHLLMQITKTPDLILPVKGYRTTTVLTATGIRSES